MDNKFGEYLRYLRTTRNPVVTQESLAKAIGRGKMTISQFEQGKNSPPQGNLLSKIIRALKLDSKEEEKLLFLSAKSRKSIPQDIEKYFFENPYIYTVIRVAMKNPILIDWKKIATSKVNVL